MLSAPTIILTLKVAVIAVTILLLASMVPLWRGNYRLHGQINIVFFALTITALLSLELVARLIEPQMFSDYFTMTDAWDALVIHLCFSLPAALMLPLMLYTGWTRKRRAHIALAIVFSVLWAGTFITGVFFLPHH